jgi:hypothetical protein
MLRLFGGAKSAQMEGTQPEGLDSPGVDRFRVLGGWIWSEGTKGEANRQTEVLVYCFGGSSFHVPPVTEEPGLGKGFKGLRIPPTPPHPQLLWN